MLYQVNLEKGHYYTHRRNLYLNGIFIAERCNGKNYSFTSSGAFYQPLNSRPKTRFEIGLTLFRLGGGGGGAFDATPI